MSNNAEKLAKIVSASLELSAASQALITAEENDLADEVLLPLLKSRENAQSKLDALIDYGFNDYGDMQPIFDAANGVY